MLAPAERASDMVVRDERVGWRCQDAYQPARRAPPGAKACSCRRNGMLPQYDAVLLWMHLHTPPYACGPIDVLLQG